MEALTGPFWIVLAVRGTAEGRHGQPMPVRVAGMIGNPAEEGRGQGDEAHRDGDGKPPPEIPTALFVADDRVGVIGGEDGRVDNGGKGGVGEIVERPRNDRTAR